MSRQKICAIHREALLCHEIQGTLEQKTLANSGVLQQTCSDFTIRDRMGVMGAGAAVEFFIVQQNRQTNTTDLHISEWMNR